jgi:methionine synthase II (cobalamin-independent)
MSKATGVGSMPGEDATAYAEAMRVVLGELTADLPFVPELPGRGIGAGMVGRALGLVPDLGVDLQPAGWRLTGSTGGSGVDHRRARSLLAQDLDQVEELADGYTGAFKIQVAGPWTLAATVEKPRGDKVLSDHGARRELAQGLAEGLGEHVADVRRRLPGADRLVVQVDEPALAAVLAARIPTASGFGRHRSIYPPEAAEALGWVTAAVERAGGEPWVHSCAPETPLALLRASGARGLSVDVTQLSAADLDVLGEAFEAGESIALGVVPSTEPEVMPATTAVIERVRRWLDVLGLDPEQVHDQLFLSPACGLAGATAAYARSALRTCREAAADLEG